jgi:hypothetical protein
MLVAPLPAKQQGAWLYAEVSAAAPALAPQLHAARLLFQLLCLTNYQCDACAVFCWCRDTVVEVMVQPALLLHDAREPLCKVA